MPESLKQQDPSLQNCLTLLRAVWQTEYGQVYQILRGLPWPDLIQPLVRRYESMLFMLSRVLHLVETNHVYLLLRFLPRQDLNFSEQVLRSYQTTRSCNLPWSKSEIS
jgi:hypothetical protein